MIGLCNLKSRGARLFFTFSGAALLVTRSTMAVIGVDLGGTKVSAAAFSEDGRLLDRAIERLEGRKGSEVSDLIVQIAARFIDEQTRCGEVIKAVGVSVPGIYYASTGRVWAPNIPGWDDFPLHDTMTSALGNDLPVHIASDRACYILGEAWQGEARGCRDAIFLSVGTGIGAGIMAGGEVLRGHHDIAGAIGWLALDRNFRPEYKTYGCFEYHASGDGLARVARDLLESRNEYRSAWRHVKSEALTAKDLFEAYERGDPLATEVLEEAITFWGMAVANLVSLFNPEMIIMGGGVFGPAARFLDRIREEASRWAQPISMREVKITVTRLGGDAGLYGAAFHSLRALHQS